MAYVDTHVLPGLRAKGLTVVDLRGKLPRNTQYPQLKKWSTRPLSAITLYAWHWPASPVRPPMPYDEVARLAAFARGHSTMDWGNGYRAPTITYHTAIGGSGTLYLLNQWEDSTWHASNANGIALGFMVDVGVGQEPLPQQIVTAEVLADFVSVECPEIPADQWDHYGHGELTDFSNATACPGSVLPFIRTYRAEGDMVRRILEEPMIDQGIIDEYERQIADLRKEIGDLHSAAGATDAHVVQPLTAERDALRIQVDQLRQELAELQAQPAPPGNVTRIELRATAHLSDGSAVPVPVGVA